MNWHDVVDCDIWYGEARWKLDEVVFKGSAFELTKPISVALYQEDHVWYCEYEPCGIISAGDTAEEAVHSFSEDFAVLWDEIAQCPDDSLTVEAQATKRCLLSLVKTIKTTERYPATTAVATSSRRLRANEILSKGIERWLKRIAKQGK